MNLLHMDQDHGSDGEPTRLVEHDQVVVDIGIVLEVEGVHL